ncbi:MAG: hypothetical protein IJ306_02100, partial [Oscillospiraceae bacterium]|nr:hypothetical protein [Oscillospiraceae bacterium]
NTPHRRGVVFLCSHAMRTRARAIKGPLKIPTGFLGIRRVSRAAEEYRESGVPKKARLDSTPRWGRHKTTPRIGGVLFFLFLCDENAQKAPIGDGCFLLSVIERVYPVGFEVINEKNNAA